EAFSQPSARNLKQGIGQAKRSQDPAHLLVGHIEFPADISLDALDANAVDVGQHGQGTGPAQDLVAYECRFYIGADKQIHGESRGASARQLLATLTATEGRVNHFPQWLRPT